MVARRGSTAADRGWAGTRGGLGRVAAMAIGLAVLLLLAAAGEARAGAYRVAQCGWGVGAELDPTYPATEGVAFSLDPTACAPPPGAGPAGMKFEAGVAPDGVRGLARARWVAPPGTIFIAADLTWSGSPQPNNWQGLAVDVGDAFQLLTATVTPIGPTPVDLHIDGPAWAFEAFLECLVGGPDRGCTRSVPSVMRLSRLTFNLLDQQAPQAQLGGALSAAGWHRGTAALEVGGADVGAGVALETAAIDGVPVLSAAPPCAVATIEGESRATRLAPCPATATRAVAVDTARLADGPHLLRGCATDFSGAQGCAPDATIEIDNSPPAISFAAAAEGAVAATVSDRYSGPAAGTISVRRADAEAWSDLPTTFDRDGDGTATLTARLPDLSGGVYRFRATASDTAGNAGSAELRVAGGPAELRRQAAEGSGGGTSAASRGGGGPAPRARATHLTVALVASGRGADSRARRLLVDARATATATAADGRASGSRTNGSGLTVDYGTAVEVRGQLTDARGVGIGRRAVAVTVRAAAGIGAPERHRVLTDPAGRFVLRLPPGTSRRVTVAFHGGRGLAPARRRSLPLRVRAGVRLTADPAALHTGESVRLRGRVRLGPARVSGRGKLIAIQYLERATKRWRPALVVRTDAAGRFDTSYRFRYVTGVARIRLRATAPAEGGWPFARGSSSPLTITVRSG
jgi:hypothetical protein